MPREPEIYLSKIQQMCNFLLSRSRGVAEAEYLADLEFQLAAERAFILIAEAMILLRTHSPQVSVLLDQHLAAIGFRNLLVHRYWDVDNTEVWSIITTEIGPLKAAVDQLLLPPPLNP